MAQPFLDQNVSQRIGPALWSSGHDVVFAGQIGAAAFTDDELLLAAVRADRVFVTHNRRDFRMLHDAWVTWPAAFGLALPPHPGILILDSAPLAVLATELAAFLEAVPATRLANGVFWWHRRDGWRQPGAGANWEPRQ